MRTFRKFLSLLLTAAVAAGVLAAVPVTALAAGVISDAEDYTMGSTAQGSITETNIEDIYGFTLDDSSRITLDMTAYIERTNYYLYNENGDTVWEKTWVYWNSTSEVLMFNQEIDLTAGTYYFCIERNRGTGNYEFSIQAESAGESFKETTGGINNSMKDASPMEVGTSYNGQIASNDDRDFYSFTLEDSSRITLDMTAYIERTNYYLYDENGNDVWKETWMHWNDTSEVLMFTRVIDLTAGTYYFCVEENSGTGNYRFSMQAVSANESIRETTGGINNSMKDASPIELGTIYNGQIASNDDKDFYSFTISKSEAVTLDMTAYIERTNYYIYDESGNTVWEKTWVNWNNTSEVLMFTEEIDLTAGTYYLCVEESNGTGNYRFSVSDEDHQPFELGNVDQQGGVTASDALLALQAATGKATLSAAQEMAADVDENGNITANDALMILQYATQKISSF